MMGQISGPGSEGGTDVLLVDDHPLILLGLQEHLRSVGIVAAAADISSLESLIEQIRRMEPKVVALDYDIPQLGIGTEVVRIVAAEHRCVVMLTGTTDPDKLGSCVAAGAQAVIGKHETLDDIAQAIDAAVRGQRLRRQEAATLRSIHDEAARLVRSRLARFELLSGREQVVLCHLMKGNSPSAVAQLEYVSVDTVRTQIKSILRKLGVSSQLEAVAAAYQAGWDGPGINDRSD